MAIADDKKELTDEVKASVLNSGALANLKQVSFEGKSLPDKSDLDDLKQQAVTAIENIQQLLDGSKLDDGSSQKLVVALAKLKTALGKGSVSREALAMALSDAAAAISGTDASDKGMSAQQKADQLWKKVEADNKDIDDDFTKMQKAGIAFNQSLMDRHKELMEDLQAHPRDIAKQKELDAVDDALLVQAEPQIGKNPNAKTSFDDAKTKSKDRHEAVDKDLANVNKRAALNSMAFDDDVPSSGGDITMNDVTPQSIGQKPKSAGKQQI